MHDRALDNIMLVVCTIAMIIIKIATIHAEYCIDFLSSFFNVACILHSPSHATPKG